MEGVIQFLSAAVIAGTPLLFATIGEVFTQRSGHLNLGVEGMMLMGAVSGFSAGLSSQNPIVALLAAMLGGAAGALIYAILTVTLRAEQNVTGLALTIFGTGLSAFMGKELIGQIVPEAVKAFFKPISLPVLGQIPVIGPVFFRHDAFVYLGYLVAIIGGIYLFKTRLGLNLRSVGENPAAADAAGINITLYKYLHILIGGALCGLGGAYLSLVYVPAWQENITAGRGWIAVALVIFANWNPYKALLGAYVFGGLDILRFRVQSLNLPINDHFIAMLPYLVTIIVLVVASMRNSKDNAAPKGLAVPYFREER